MKLSFSVGKSKTAAAAARLNPVASDEPSAGGSASKGPQFVTEFDPTKPLSSEQTLVIEPMSNSEYTKRFKPSSLPTEADDPNIQFSTETQFVLDTNNAADTSGLKYGLQVRTDKEKEENGKKEEKESDRPRVGRVDHLKRFKEVFENSPQDRGQDEFSKVTVEEYAKAIMRGYGWSEGKVIGRNKDKEDTKIKIVERRGGQFGLGFNPSASDPKKKRGGEWTLHVDNAKDKKTKSSDLERERSGRSSRREERGDSSKRNGKDLDRERGDSSSRRRNSKDLERDRERDGNRRNGKSVEREKSSSRRKEEERERERSNSKNKEKEKEKVNNSNSKRETKQIRWLTSHIRVRIISKDLKRGKYHLKKGEIIDVVGPTTCDISIEGDLVQGVEQEMLETALPKKGGVVLVLYGKKKGVLGNLMEKDLDEEIAIVRDLDSHEMIEVKLGEIAEFVGDPDLFDY